MPTTGGMKEVSRAASTVSKDIGMEVEKKFGQVTGYFWTSLLIVPHVL